MVVLHDDNRVPFRPPERQAMLRERGLRASEERMRRSLEAAGLGHWDYDYLARRWCGRSKHANCSGSNLAGPHPGRCCAPARTRGTAHGSRNTSRAAPTSMPITFATSGSA
jgi:hypothetical protein